MGQLKVEALSLIHQFLSEHKESPEETFAAHLKILLKQLSLLSSQDQYLIINTDGSSKGNPGKARIGIQFRGPDHHILLRESREIGIKTNNEAEYIAILEALKLALKKKYRKVLLYSDSQVVINQLNHTYKIKEERLRPYYQEIQSLLEQFEEVQLRYIRREENRTADILSN